MTSKINNKFLFIAGLVLFATISRFIPHPPNFAPIAAIALFSGTYFENKKIAFLLPFSALFLSDLFLGFYTGFWVVYFAFALIILFGFLLKKNIKFGTVLGAALLSSISFFVITNFGVWMSGMLYPMNLGGLIACYVAAIPFFQNSLIGDLVYTGVLFGAYEIVKAKLPVLVGNTN